MTKHILQVKDLDVAYRLPRKRLFAPITYLQAVTGVSFTLNKGETLGVVGESGCGKSTLARAILRLIPTRHGHIYLKGDEITTLKEKDMRVFRQDMQVIFQDPYAALNPRLTIRESIAEPYKNYHPKLRQKDILPHVKEMLERVGLNANMINRYPHEFSGGQCQRVGIARALMLAPELIICDEPVSALDVSIQAQIINLLMKLQREAHISYIFISHNLSVVRHISHKIMVLYLGRIMEFADREELFYNPKHPYTKSLLSAIPIPDVEVERTRKHIILKGVIPSPLNPPSGCVFHTRCPIAQDICRVKVPELKNYGKDQHLAACHFAEENTL